MAKKYTAEELNKLSDQELAGLVLSLQEQISSLNESYERLIEQIRIADQNLLAAGLRRRMSSMGNSLFLTKRKLTPIRLPLNRRQKKSSRLINGKNTKASAKRT